MERKETRLVIDSELKNVSLVGRAINELCSNIPSSHLSPYEIELCVVEAVNNCIEHAYGKEKGHEVEVRLTVHQDRFVVDICDTGQPMDPQRLERAKLSILETDHEDLDTIAEEGRGLPIIKKIMDTVVYESKSGRNRLSMTKFFVS